MVPPVKQWIDGKLKDGQIKDVRIEDLLERNPIKINNPVLRKELDNKVILITGAAGSIGSEIANQVRKYDNMLGKIRTCCENVRTCYGNPWIIYENVRESNDI